MPARYFAAHAFMQQGMIREAVQLFENVAGAQDPLLDTYVSQYQKLSLEYLGKIKKRLPSRSCEPVDPFI